MIIVELSSGCRRQPTVGGADSSVDPVTHIISPDHSLQLVHSVVLRLVLTAVDPLWLSRLDFCEVCVSILSAP